MFKEILVFMLCLQFSNGYSWDSGVIGMTKNRSCKEKASDFLEHNNYWAGAVKYTVSKICILNNYQREEIQENPAKFNSESSSQTSIKIEISKFQIIKIYEDSVKMSFCLKVYWVDQRLQVLRYTYFPYFSFHESEQDSIWIPHLEVGNEMISNDEKGKYVSAGELGNYTSGAWVEKGIAITTEVTCALDFKTFPFEHHACSIEVRICSLLLKYLIKKIRKIYQKISSLWIKRMKQSLKISL